MSAGGGASLRAAARAARRRSLCTWHKRWPKRLRRQEVGAAVVAADASAGAVGTGPGPVERQGWSSCRLVRRMR
jgi:hypothetical protein